MLVIKTNEECIEAGEQCSSPHCGGRIKAAASERAKICARVVALCDIVRIHNRRRQRCVICFAYQLNQLQSNESLSFLMIEFCIETAIRQQNLVRHYLYDKSEFPMYPD